MPSYHRGPHRSQEFIVKAQQAGFSPGDPVLIRIFKRESKLELWMRKDDRYELFATYPICLWSGRLGPKEREGDRQAPEGFYSFDREQLRIGGRHPRSINIGFPNAFDRASGRTGSYILLHGGCTSIGCFAMTDPVMDEIYTLAEQALLHGQDRIHTRIPPAISVCHSAYVVAATDPDAEPAPSAPASSAPASRSQANAAREFCAAAMNAVWSFREPSA